MGKRILVTGGAGFLGSHLCERLLDAGHDVLCVDNYFTGTKDNIAKCLDNKHFELMRHDVTFPLYVEVDEIYNLACPASPVHYQFDPVQTTKTSVHGAINVLGLGKRIKAKVFQASTSEVYGDPDVHPQPESYRGNVNPIGPRACYDEGKRCAETLFFDYHRQHKLRIKVVRIFNTYGPRMHPNDGRVVSNFIMQALRNDAKKVFDKAAYAQFYLTQLRVVPTGGTDAALLAFRLIDPAIEATVVKGDGSKVAKGDAVMRVDQRAFMVALQRRQNCTAFAGDLRQRCMDVVECGASVHFGLAQPKQV